MAKIDDSIIENKPGGKLEGETRTLVVLWWPEIDGHPTVTSEECWKGLCPAVDDVDNI